MSKPVPATRDVFTASCACSTKDTGDTVAYAREVHAVDPSPILINLVSVSIPTSPANRVGSAFVHWDAVPLLNCSLTDIVLPPSYIYFVNSLYYFCLYHATVAPSKTGVVGSTSGLPAS